jgi:hypothetical protein
LNVSWSLEKICKTAHESLSLITVPTGTGRATSSASAQYWSLGLPFSPGLALKFFLNLYFTNVFSSFDDCKIIEPPLPPSPHDGHPKGTHASLLHVTAPSHHLPDCTDIVTSS